MPQTENSKLEQQNKGKSPAFQFYPKDFLTDDKVLIMNPEIRGLYITLLCVDWIQDGFDPGPNWFRGLTLAGFEWHEDDGAFRETDKAIAQLSGCFVPHPTKEGFVTNPRLLKERAGQATRSAERAKAGRKGADNRWKVNNNNKLASDGRAIAQPMANDGSSSSSSSSSSIINKKSALSSADYVSPEDLNNGKVKILDFLYFDEISIDTWKAKLGIKQFERACEKLNGWIGQSKGTPDFQKRKTTGENASFALQNWVSNAVLNEKSEKPKTQDPPRPRLKPVVMPWEKPDFKPMKL